MSSRNIVLAILVVAALAGAGILTAGVVLNGDGAPAENDDGGVDENTAEPGEEDETSDAGNGNDPDDDASNADEPNADGDGDPDGQSGEVASPDEDSETRAITEMPVAIYAADRGPIEDGELRLYNQTSGELVTTHDFSDGHRTVFRNLTRTTTYDLVVNVSFYPDETIAFNPRVSDEVNETIGYEFQGAETYEMDWWVDSLPTNVDIDDENAEKMATTDRGYSAMDAEGNYYSRWGSRGIPGQFEYLYIAAENQTYYNSPRRNSEWVRRDSYWGDPGTARETVVREGLSEAKNRTFVETIDADGFTYDEIHVYNISSNSIVEGAHTVHVDPDTGYVLYADARIEKIENPRATRAEAEIYSHNSDNFAAIPDDFPIENKNND